MKKTKIIFGLMLSLSINSNAQDVWTPGSGTDITTTTPGNCYVQGDQMTIGSSLLSSYVAPGDILTVKDQIGLWPSGPSLGVTRINGNTPDGAFLLQCNTTQINGASISLYGKPGNNMIRYISPNSNPLTGHIFQSYVGSDFQTNAVITNDGRMMIGKEMLTSWAAPGDVLTVRDQIGLWPSGPSLGVTRINGNTPNGAMLIQSNTTQTDGPSISMYGNPGNYMIRYISPNSNPLTGHIFQSYVGNDFQTNTVITNDGRMMVGKDMLTSWAAPGDILTVRDQIGLWPSGTSAGVTNLNGNAPTGAFMIHGNTSEADGPTIGMYGGPGGGAIKYVSHGSTWLGHIFANYDPTETTPVERSRMVITNKGKVLIGEDIINTISAPGDYNLYVSKGILTEKLKVASADGVNWSDFVFNSDYGLRPLCDVESYIASNKHLPEIPSANEVAKEGIDIAEMDARLLQKIEELTLYVIQQQKEINELKNQVRK